MASKNQEGNNSFFIENEPGPELPSTGGPGTKLIYLAGIIITLLASVYLLRRKGA